MYIHVISLSYTSEKEKLCENKTDFKLSIDPFMCKFALNYSIKNGFSTSFRIIIDKYIITINV